MSDTTRNQAGVARRRHRMYSLEFKQQVVQEALQPGASVAEVARKHDLNDNLVFAWRRLYRLGELGLPAPVAHTELLPVSVIDLPEHTPAPQETTTHAHGVLATGCDVEIEVGKRRVRIRGLSMERAERFLRDCLQ